MLIKTFRKNFGGGLKLEGNNFPMGASNGGMEFPKEEIIFQWIFQRAQKIWCFLVQLRIVEFREKNFFHLKICFFKISRGVPLPIALFATPLNKQCCNVLRSGALRSGAWSGAQQNFWECSGVLRPPFWFFDLYMEYSPNNFLDLPNNVQTIIWYV